MGRHSRYVDPKKKAAAEGEILRRIGLSSSLAEMVEGNAISATAKLVGAQRAKWTASSRAAERRGTLARLGVQLIDPSGPTLKCEACGSEWTPAMVSVSRAGVQPYQQLPRGYWRCPQLCNRDRRSS